jgi:hypothetical protein
VEENHDEVGRSDAFFDWSREPAEGGYYTRERVAQGLLLLMRREQLVVETIYATVNSIASSTPTATTSLAG